MLAVIFFTDDLMSASEKLSFQYTLEFQKQSEISWSQVRRIQQKKRSFSLKTATLEANNVPAC
jgi:hypothetical protein